MRRWVEEIAGEDEEYEPIIKNLSKHANLFAFEKFKKTCEDDEERKDFIEKCRKSTKDTQLDED